jgi:hypothetical protein
LKYRNEDRDSYFTSDTNPGVNGSIAMFILSVTNFIVALVVQATSLGNMQGITYFTFIGTTLTH